MNCVYKIKSRKNWHVCLLPPPKKIKIKNVCPFKIVAFFLPQKVYFLPGKSCNICGKKIKNIHKNCVSTPPPPAQNEMQLFPNCNMTIFPLENALFKPPSFKLHKKKQVFLNFFWRISFFKCTFTNFFSPKTCIVFLWTKEWFLKRIATFCQKEKKNQTLIIFILRLNIFYNSPPTPHIFILIVWFPHHSSRFVILLCATWMSTTYIWRCSYPISNSVFCACGHVTWTRTWHAAFRAPCSISRATGINSKRDGDIKTELPKRHSVRCHVQCVHLLPVAPPCR